MEQKSTYIDSELKDYIKLSILPQYKTFDKAHNLTHVETVISESLILAKTLSVSTNMV